MTRDGTPGPWKMAPATVPGLWAVFGPKLGAGLIAVPWEAEAIVIRDALNGARPALTVETLAGLIRQAGEEVLGDDYSMRGESGRLAAWLLPRLAGPV